MFRFEHPAFIWFALVSLGIIALYFIRRSLGQKDWAVWGTDASNLKVTRTQVLRPTLMWIGSIALALLTIAAVNPQWGFRTVPVENKSADLYLVMDISNSMLAEDIAPSRLERSRRVAMDIASTFKTDKVGLILFAGNAYMQSPLTTDWHAIQLFLNAAHPNQAGTQGTAIGEAIRLAIKPKSDGTSGQGAIIVLTDGEDHDTEAPDAVSEAAAIGWTTYVIGFGTPEGATIPVIMDGRRDVHRDESGQPVQTALNRNLMMELAKNGNGKYFDGIDGQVIINDLKKELARLERSQLETRSFSEHRSYYQWFLLPALLLIFFLVMYNYKYDVI